MLKCAILLALPLFASCFIFGRNQSNWDGLKVTWGLNPFSSFQSVPRTRSEALGDGWVSLTPGVKCDDNPNFKGERFIKGHDTGVILIYDPAGYIAGMQIGFPKDYVNNKNHYPYTNLINAPFVLENGVYYLTAYFVNPASVCRGRTSAQFKQDGTGTGLWIQNGTNPITNSMAIPRTLAEVDKSRWTKGSCFVSMGLHYWYNLRKDMPCNEFYPVFLLYNGGVLNAFGWALGIDLGSDVSNRIEHPPPSSYGTFMNPVPDCLSTMGTLTTLHIYLTDSATADTC